MFFFKKTIHNYIEKLKDELPLISQKRIRYTILFYRILSGVLTASLALCLVDLIFGLRLIKRFLHATMHLLGFGAA